MKVWILMLATALAVLPASAEDVAFKGRTLDVSANGDVRLIQRMSGTQYAIRLTREELVNKANACLSGVGGVAIESADVEQGLLVANVRTGFRASFAAQTLRSRLQMDAGDGYFQFAESELALAQADEGGAETWVQLVQGGSIWEKGLDLLIQTENKLVDCLYK